MILFYFNKKKRKDTEGKGRQNEYEFTMDPMIAPPLPWIESCY